MRSRSAPKHLFLLFIVIVLAPALLLLHIKINASQVQENTPPRNRPNNSMHVVLTQSHILSQPSSAPVPPPPASIVNSSCHIHAFPPHNGAPPADKLPQWPSLNSSPSGFHQALQQCPGLRHCNTTHQPLLYPIVAHRNRLAPMAQYVATMAAAGHDTVLLPGRDLTSGSDSMPWWRHISDAPYSADLLLPWARCTCILISDFNTTFSAGAVQGDPPSTWSLAKHGHLRDVVNRQWPGHVAWVSNTEVFSSALGTSVHGKA